MEQVRIAVFASGRGSNAKALFERLKEHSRIELALIVSDREDAGVLELGRAEKIPFKVLHGEEILDGSAILRVLEGEQIDLIVLAGYFKKIPEAVVEAYRGRILNVHPALLPEFGGKGMYGEHVHRAVLEEGKEKSGITVHRVDEHYDNGDILFQKPCPVKADDTPQTLAERVKALEHRYYPECVIEEARKLLYS